MVGLAVSWDKDSVFELEGCVFNAVRRFIHMGASQYRPAGRGGTCTPVSECVGEVSVSPVRLISVLSAPNGAGLRP